VIHDGSGRRFSSRAMVERRWGRKWTNRRSAAPASREPTARPARAVEPSPECCRPTSI
jgi:hypothetical protein